MATKSDIAVNRAKESTVTDIATIDDQIKEDKLAVRSGKDKIKSYRDAIRAEQDDVRMREERIERNKSRKTVFIRARAELEVIDVGSD